jgi:hypothetical protein
MTAHLRRLLRSLNNTLNRWGEGIEPARDFAQMTSVAGL